MSQNMEEMIIHRIQVLFHRGVDKDRYYLSLHKHKFELKCNLQLIAQEWKYLKYNKNAANIKILRK